MSDVVTRAARAPDPGFRREEVVGAPRALLHRLFEAHARRAPRAPAVRHRGRELAYGEVDAAANRLARRLRALGVRPEDRVGVAVERSPELVVALLGILKAGAAYVPLDPEYPEERLAYMLADAGVSALVVSGGVPPALSAHRGAVVSLEGDRAALEALPSGAPDVDVDAEGLAYIVYTSGSTGRPKGVALPHRAMARLVAGESDLVLAPGDRAGQTATLSFDAAAWEIWAALAGGACLVVLDREETLSPPALARRVGEEGVTVLFLTTALFNQVAAYAPETFRGLRMALFGGEAADPEAARRVLERGRPGRLLHMYGPAESATYATGHAVEAVPPGAATVPIGRAVPWTRVFVLDDSLRPVAEGGEGEVYVGGEGLARGYFGRPALTAGRFVPDAVSGEAGARLYRTGDVVRVLPGGVLAFAGRVDDQVKVRGFRIEPGEVTAALAAHPALSRAFVAAREDAPGERRLVAYVVPRAEAPSSDELRAFLARTLPPHMLPSAFVALEALPLTPNGKVDRRALPAPPSDRSAFANEYVAPRTETERAVARIWAEVLGFGEVGAEDGFFALGGHSLAATQVVSRVRETL
ncbi:MAG TPA: non-ribosomal peptide synthetase, partial [Longimicrobium sp.]|nr:non-ribosomal peptide synthetase [Longimicrobium sp.]